MATLEAERLENFIIKNYGATIKHNEVHAYESGYQVGFKANSSSVSEDMLAETIDHYLGNFDEFGVWLNEDTGLYDIDVGTNVQDLDEAIALAKREGQVAIWDWANGEVIMVADA